MILRVKNIANIKQGSLIRDEKPQIKGVSAKKKAEAEFAFQCVSRKLPPFHRNYRFATSILHPETRKPRQWQFDFAWPEYRVCVEVEGLVIRRIDGELVTLGRHANPEGFREDCIKYAYAQILGWSLLRFEQIQVKSGVAVNFAMDLLAVKGWQGVLGTSSS